jgi:hypothetical protein
MRPCIEQSSGPVSLLPSQSCPDCITNTSGYDFLKQVLVDLEGRQVWPDASASVRAAMLVAGSVPHCDDREWWELNEERQRQHRTANEEMARYYYEQTRLQEERQNRELNECR